MEKFVLDLIKRFAYILNGTRVLNPRTNVRRISEIHPVYADINTPADCVARLGIEEVNPDFTACESFKKKCQPIAFFPGQMENNFPYCAYPIYLVAPWEFWLMPNALTCMRGLVLFNRVIGPDKIVGPQFDNELGQWGAVLLKNEIALKNFSYQDHDRALEMALGENWRDVNWLRDLLKKEKILYKLK